MACRKLQFMCVILRGTAANSAIISTLRRLQTLRLFRRADGHKFCVILRVAGAANPAYYLAWQRPQKCMRCVSDNSATNSANRITFCYGIGPPYDSSCDDTRSPQVQNRKGEVSESKTVSFFFVFLLFTWCFLFLINI